MTALPKPHLTIEEYIELDKNSEERFEYFDGEIFAMAGGSPSHARIAPKPATKTVAAITRSISKFCCAAIM